MKRRIQIAAASVMVAAGLIGAVAAPASAAPTLKPAENLCKAQGGNFSAASDTDYSCFAASRLSSEGQLQAARAVCTEVVKLSSFSSAGRNYHCFGGLQ